MLDADECTMYTFNTSAFVEVNLNIMNRVI